MSAIAELEEHDLQLNNLFQLRDGRWQANVRRGDNCFEFGHGSNAETALRNAISAANKAPKETPSVFD
jgi:hypothetical protein